jgi:hypothetical protein
MALYLYPAGIGCAGDFRHNGPGVGLGKHSAGLWAKRWGGAWLRAQSSAYLVPGIIIIIIGNLQYLYNI